MGDVQMILSIVALCTGGGLFAAGLWLGLRLGLALGRARAVAGEPEVDLTELIRLNSPRLEQDQTE